MTTTQTGNKPLKSSAQKAKPTKKQILEVIEKTKSKAEEYARDPKKAKKLLDDAVKKTKSFKKDRGPLAKVWSYLTALWPAPFSMEMPWIDQNNGMLIYYWYSWRICQ